MNYKHLTGEQRQQVRNNHVAQVEQQHYSAQVQLERDKAAGRDTAPIEKLIADLEAEHKQLVQKRGTAK